MVVQEAFDIYEFRVGVEESSGLWLDAKRTTYDLVLGVVGVEVNTADEHGRIGRGSGDDDLLGTALEVSRRPAVCG